MISKSNFLFIMVAEIINKNYMQAIVALTYTIIEIIFAKFCYIRTHSTPS
jgi:hypothetical protein